MGLCLLIGQSVCAEVRYVATLRDGTPVEDVEIRNWQNAAAKPQIAGKLIFDAGNPATSVIARQHPPGQPPQAYVEFVGGDRLPGRVIGARTGTENPFEALPAHLLMQPLAELQFPDDRPANDVRVITRSVQRIVWQTQPGDYRAQSAILRNGSVVPYRSLRWENEGIRVLTNDGVREIRWDDLAELHLPRLEAWDGYFDQLAAINPQAAARMIQIETVDGGRYTTSQERFRAQNWGDAGRDESWLQRIQPAWSLDPLWLRFHSIHAWRFFEPAQVPLTAISPEAVERQPVFGGSWNYQIDRNATGGWLQSADRQFRGGFGVMASTRLRFPLSPLVRAVRTQAGLDRAAGTGGCVTLSVSAGAAEPLFQVEHLVGSERVVDTGWMDIPNAGRSTLTLAAEMDHERRPTGADPFDIRDLVNWYEPELQLDADLLPAELARRGVSHLSGLAGWTIAPTDAEKIEIVNTIQGEDSRRPEFRRTFRVKEGAVTLRRKLKIGPHHQWLAITATRARQESTPTSVLVRVDGNVQEELGVPARERLLEPDPLLVDVADLQGKTVVVEMVIQPRGEQSFVDWRGASLLAERPGLLKLFEEETDFATALSGNDAARATISTEQPYSGKRALAVSSGDVRNAKLPGLDVLIAEQPRLGEYRYLVFAWKKTGGGWMRLQLAHADQFGEEWAEQFPPGERTSRRRLGQFGGGRQLEDRGIRQGFSYEAGGGKASTIAPIRISAKAPEMWELQVRDLIADFGTFRLTGLGFESQDGTAWFDHIYLARTKDDVNALRRGMGDELRIAPSP